MEGLMKENEALKNAVENILEEIEDQKELNQQHEAEIETLLKFNERLLSIIEN
jgi:ATP-dependent helicase/DNAse subunit B